MATSLFKNKILMVTLVHEDPCMRGWIVMSNPKITKHDGDKFIEGLFEPNDPNNYLHGKRILIPMKEVVSITEFNSVDEIWSKKRNRKQQRKDGK